MRITSLLILLSVILFAGCKSSSMPPSSPTEVLKSYVEASQKQDTATMKSLLSQDSLRYIEEKAAPLKLSVDDVLRRETQVKIQKAPEMRNEKIEGETATVEVQNPATGIFDVKYPFVRENGAWKLARDKYIKAFEEELKKSNEAANVKSVNPTPSNADSTVNANENKP